jgi:hypothetical protein
MTTEDRSAKADLTDDDEVKDVFGQDEDVRMDGNDGKQR